MANGVRNANLDEAPLPASLYNALPHIDTMKEAAAVNAEAHSILLGLVALHGLSQHFSIHLIHKHFDVPDGRVMVYETIDGPNHPEFVLCSPQKPASCRELRGLYFQARPGGKMAAYEYTTDAGEDLSAHTSFVARFAQAVLDHGVQDVFALTAKEPRASLLTEFEMSDRLSTILVNNSAWLQQGLGHSTSTSTDWIARADYEAHASGLKPTVPGIIALKCLVTRSNKHINVTCSTTRSGAHYEVTNGDGKSGQWQELLLDGEPLAADSEPFAIISRAREMTEVF